MLKMGKLKLTKVWVIYYGAIAYDGSWETETEAQAFADAHSELDVVVSILEVQRLNLELAA